MLEPIDTQRLAAMAASANGGNYWIVAVPNTAASGTQPRAAVAISRMVRLTRRGGVRRQGAAVGRGRCADPARDFDEGTWRSRRSRCARSGPLGRTARQTTLPALTAAMWARRGAGWLRVARARQR